jgi:hypothetical protein
MHTQTIERNPARFAFGTTRAAAYVGAAALITGVIWYALAEHGVTTATAPAASPQLSDDINQRRYYQWLASTFPQERLYDGLIIVGFLCLAAVAVSLHSRIGREQNPSGRDQDLARAPWSLVSIGAALWITGTVFQLGAHRAVGLMATHSNPIETTNSIAFTADTVASTFALAAFTVTGAGLLAAAVLAARTSSWSRPWAAYTAIIAAVMLAIAVTYAFGPDDLNDVLLIAGGAVLLPGWLAWTGHRS